MKRNIILVCSLLLTSLFMASCSGDYEDASSKHEYGTDENPYLRSDASALVTNTTEFQVGSTDAYTLDLTPYDTLFQSKLGMSLSQVISGISNGTVVFEPINSGLSRWEKSSYTSGTGWYFNENNKPCTAADSTAKATLTFDAASKSLKLALVKGVQAGTALDINVGFAVNGTDYDKYVRFEFKVSVTDLSIIMQSLSMATADYDGATFDLTPYENNFEACLGMSVADALKGVVATPQTVKYYVCDNNGTWDTASSYTADNTEDVRGYWINADSKVCNWGNTGYSVYANLSVSGKNIFVGRAPGLASGTVVKINLVLAKADDATKFVKMILTCTMQ